MARPVVLAPDGTLSLFFGPDLASFAFDWSCVDESGNRLAQTTDVVVRDRDMVAAQSPSSVRVYEPGATFTVGLSNLDARCGGTTQVDRATPWSGYSPATLAPPGLTTDHSAFEPLTLPGTASSGRYTWTFQCDGLDMVVGEYVFLVDRVPRPTLNAARSLVVRPQPGVLPGDTDIYMVSLPCTDPDAFVRDSDPLDAGTPPLTYSVTQSTDAAGLLASTPSFGDGAPTPTDTLSLTVTRTATGAAGRVFVDWTCAESSPRFDGSERPTPSVGGTTSTFTLDVNAAPSTVTVEILAPVLDNQLAGPGQILTLRATCTDLSPDDTLTLEATLTPAMVEAGGRLRASLDPADNPATDPGTLRLTTLSNSGMANPVEFTLVMPVVAGDYATPVTVTCIDGNAPDGSPETPASGVLGSLTILSPFRLPSDEASGVMYERFVGSLAPVEFGTLECSADAPAAFTVTSLTMATYPGTGPALSLVPWTGVFGANPSFDSVNQLAGNTLTVLPTPEPTSSYGFAGGSVVPASSPGDANPNTVAVVSAQEPTLSSTFPAELRTVLWERVVVQKHQSGSAGGAPLYYTTTGAEDPQMTAVGGLAGVPVLTFLRYDDTGLSYVQDGVAGNLVWVRSDATSWQEPDSSQTGYIPVFASEHLVGFASRLALLWTCEGASMGVGNTTRSDPVSATVVFHPVPVVVSDDLAVPLVPARPLDDYWMSTAGSPSYVGLLTATPGTPAAYVDGNGGSHSLVASVMNPGTSVPPAMDTDGNPITSTWTSVYVQRRDEVPDPNDPDAPVPRFYYASYDANSGTTSNETSIAGPGSGIGLGVATQAGSEDTGFPVLVPLHYDTVNNAFVFTDTESSATVLPIWRRTDLDVSDPVWRRRSLSHIFSTDEAGLERAVAALVATTEPEARTPIFDVEAHPSVVVDLHDYCQLPYSNGSAVTFAIVPNDGTGILGGSLGAHVVVDGASFSTTGLVTFSAQYPTGTTASNMTGGWVAFPWHCRSTQAFGADSVLLTDSIAHSATAVLRVRINPAPWSPLAVSVDTLAAGQLRFQYVVECADPGGVSSADPGISLPLTLGDATVTVRNGMSGLVVQSTQPISDVSVDASGVTSGTYSLALEETFWGLITLEWTCSDGISAIDRRVQVPYYAFSPQAFSTVFETIDTLIPPFSSAHDAVATADLGDPALRRRTLELGTLCRVPVSAAIGVEFEFLADAVDPDLLQVSGNVPSATLAGNGMTATLDVGAEAVAGRYTFTYTCKGASNYGGNFTGRILVTVDGGPSIDSTSSQPISIQQPTPANPLADESYTVALDSCLNSGTIFRFPSANGGHGFPLPESVAPSESQDPSLSSVTVFSILDRVSVLPQGRPDTLNPPPQDGVFAQLFDMQPSDLTTPLLWTYTATAVAGTGVTSVGLHGITTDFFGAFRIERTCTDGYLTSSEVLYLFVNAQPVASVVAVDSATLDDGPVLAPLAGSLSPPVVAFDVAGTSDNATTVETSPFRIRCTDPETPEADLVLELSPGFAVPDHTLFENAQGIPLMPGDPGILRLEYAPAGGGGVSWTAISSGTPFPSGSSSTDYVFRFRYALADISAAARVAWTCTDAEMGTTIHAVLLRVHAEPVAIITPGMTGVARASLGNLATTAGSQNIPRGSYLVGQARCNGLPGTVYAYELLSVTVGGQASSPTTRLPPSSSMGGMGDLVTYVGLAHLDAATGAFQLVLPDFVEESDAELAIEWQCTNTFVTTLDLSVTDTFQIGEPLEPPTAADADLSYGTPLEPCSGPPDQDGTSNAAQRTAACPFDGLSVASGWTLPPASSTDPAWCNANGGSIQVLSLEIATTRDNRGPGPVRRLLPAAAAGPAEHGHTRKLETASGNDVVCEPQRVPASSSDADPSMIWQWACGDSDDGISTSLQTFTPGSTLFALRAPNLVGDLILTYSCTDDLHAPSYAQLRFVVNQPPEAAVGSIPNPALRNTLTVSQGHSDPISVLLSCRSTADNGFPVRGEVGAGGFTYALNHSQSEPVIATVDPQQSVCCLLCADLCRLGQHRY